MSNFFVAVAVFLITIIGSLFAIPHFVDWNSYRGLFEDEASRFLGRDVRVGGAVNLHLLPVPSFRLERVRIADASSTLREPFFRADSLAFKLSLAPLFRGVIEANEIEFRRPVLRLARDNSGGWNWQSFSQVFAQAAYLPSNVALTSLKISDGVLAVHEALGGERLRLENIEGELSAPAIDGPYRFRGTLGKGGAEREIRLATAKPDQEAGVRFRMSIRLAESGAVYLIDARLLELMGEPKLDGELTARLPLPGLKRTEPTQPPGDGAAEDREGGPALDLKAVLKADAVGGTLEDLALSFEQGGRPQLVTGEAKASWRDTLELEVELASRWLDLDRMGGVAAGARPIESILPLALRVRDLLPAEGRSRFELSIDQANLGGEAISALRLAAQREKGRLEIEQLRLALPGNSRTELRGALTGPAEAFQFTGSVSVRGASLMRALGWAAAKSPLPVDGKGDGAFALNAQVSVSGGRALASNIVGDLFGTPIYGEADWRWQGRPELALRVEAPQIDLRALAPASIGDALRALGHGPWSEATAATSASPSDGGAPDMRLSIDAGRLLTTNRTYREVALELKLKSGNLDLPVLRFADDRGLSVDLKGNLENVATRPKGTLSGVLAAATASDLADLAILLGVPETLRPHARLAEALSPLRVAGSLVFGARTTTSRDLTFAGEANGATLKLNGRLDGAAAGWHAGAAEVTATIDAADGRKITSLLSDAGNARADKTTPGQVLFKGKGVPAEGLSSVLAVAAGDFGLDFEGLVSLTDKGHHLAGELRLKGADAERLAVMAGLAPPLRFVGVPVEGSLRLSVDANALTLERLSLNVAGTEVRGKLALGRQGERRQVEARLDLGEMSVRSLLAPLLDQRLAAITGAAEAVLAGRPSPWPDEPFDLEGLAGLHGHVVLSLRRLGLSDGLALKDANVDLDLKGGKSSVVGVEGAAAGGRGRVTLEIGSAGGGGVDVNGSLSLVGGSLEALAGAAADAKPATAGRLALELSFRGRGTNPRHLVAALEGQGRAEIEGTLAGLWPGAISLAAEQVLKSEPDKLKSVLKQGLGQGLSAGRLTLPPQVALELGEGQLRSKPIVIDSANARASGSAAVNLQTWMFESTWRLEQTPAKETALGSKPALPAVLVAYRGPLQVLDKVEAIVDSEALERELAVRKMEHDVEQLERLRQLDETRRRNEAERMRQDLENPAPPVPVPVAPAAPARPPTPG
jgi:hypothetical protein